MFVFRAVLLTEAPLSTTSVVGGKNTSMLAVPSNSSLWNTNNAMPASALHSRYNNVATHCSSTGATTTMQPNHSGKENCRSQELRPRTVSGAPSMGWTSICSEAWLMSQPIRPPRVGGTNVPSQPMDTGVGADVHTATMHASPPGWILLSGPESSGLHNGQPEVNSLPVEAVVERHSPQSMRKLDRSSMTPAYPVATEAAWNQQGEPTSSLTLPQGSLVEADGALVTCDGGSPSLYSPMEAAGDKAIPETSGIEDWGFATPLEMELLRDEVDRLRGQLQVSQSRVSQLESVAEESVERQAEALHAARQSEERRTRLSLETALNQLRVEHLALIAKLEQQQTKPTKKDVSCPSSHDATGVAELQAVENYWRQRIREVELQREKERQRELEERQSAQDQMRDVCRRLDQAAAEAKRLSEERDRLEVEKKGLHHELERQKAPSVPAQTSPSPSTSTLMLQVEALGEEKVRLIKSHEDLVTNLRNELAQERRRNGELVQLYGGQVESLHAQLRDAVKQRKDALAALQRARERSRQVPGSRVG